MKITGHGGVTINLSQGMLGNDDPDDFILKEGKESFLHQLENARDLFEFKLQVLAKRYPKGDTLGLVKTASEVMDTLLHVKSSILLDRYIQRVMTHDVFGSQYLFIIS